MTLPRSPEQSTAHLRELDGWYRHLHAEIMGREDLIPSAKKKHLEELRREYQERWTLAADAARKDLQDWTEVYQSRAERAWQPKMPEDKDARILKALELQRLHGRIERARSDGRVGPLLAEYDRLVREGNDVLAYELEEGLLGSSLLPDDARHDFEQRVSEERHKRMGEDGRKRVAELEEWKREASAVALGLAHQEANRQRGYTPAQPGPTRLTTSYPPGRPPQVDEIVDTTYRDPALERPDTSQPRGGVIVPDPESAS